MTILWSIVSKLIIGLISLFIVVRLLGKKSLNSLTPYDFIYTLVLGGIVEESLYDDKVSIGHLLLGVGLWAILIYGIQWITYKNETVAKFLKGEPSILVFDTKLNAKAFKANKIEMEQLRTLMRQQDCYSLENAKHVILETSGEVSVIKRDESDYCLTFLIIDEGEIEETVVKKLPINEEQVRQEINSQGYDSTADIMYGEWSHEKGYYFVSYQAADNQAVRIDG